MESKQLPALERDIFVITSKDHMFYYMMMIWDDKNGMVITSLLCAEQFLASNFYWDHWHNTCAAQAVN